MATLNTPITGAGLFPAEATAVDGTSELPSPKSGILPAQAIRELIEKSHVISGTPIEEGQIQPASLDLRLGPTAYRVRASFLPGKFSTVKERIKALHMAEVDLTRPAVLEKGCIYIVPLQEQLNLPANTSGRANPKSTTGRLDIFTRLITDNGIEFEQVRSEYKGPLYVEIVSRTFTIIVGEGTRLNQLRFIRGNPSQSDSETIDLHSKETLVYMPDDSPSNAIINEGVRVSVSLEGDSGSNTVAYKAKKNAPAVDLSKLGYYPIEEFWDAVRQPRNKSIISRPRRLLHPRVKRKSPCSS
jgi:dCTP deaminase